MNCIKVIIDEDFGLKSIKLSKPKKRLASRGIVLRDDGKIAIFNKVAKNEYKLPGGGCEPGENPVDTFKREVLEETGCDVEVISELGYTEERKTLKNFQQISYVFVGKVVYDHRILNITEKEKAEGAKLIWVTVNEAFELITKCIEELKDSPYDADEDVYSTKFVVFRDKCILEHYLQLTKKSKLEQSIR